MKPHVTLHMMTSIDGRIITTNWPREFDIGDLYEQLHQALAGDAWLVGTTTMAEFSEGAPVPIKASENYPRETWKAPGAEKGPYAITLDRQGRLHLNISRANGDALVAVLVDQVSDDHLAELRRDGISYVFAGEAEIDLAVALEKLASEFGIGKLLLEGGGGVNGAFLETALIDEISLMVMPFADGERGMPTLFDRAQAAAVKLTLQSATKLEHDVVHLRYQAN